MLSRVEFVNTKGANRSTEANEKKVTKSILINDSVMCFVKVFLLVSVLPLRAPTTG